MRSSRAEISHAGLFNCHAIFYLVSDDDPFAVAIHLFYLLVEFADS